MSLRYTLHTQKITSTRRAFLHLGMLLAFCSGFKSFPLPCKRQLHRKIVQYPVNQIFSHTFRHSSRLQMSSMNNTVANSGVDEFGDIDDSALLSIDENVIMSKHSASKTSSGETNTRKRKVETSSKNFAGRVENPYKKSPSKVANPYKKASPFGSKSPFSTGTTSFYEEFKIDLPEPPSFEEYQPSTLAPLSSPSQKETLSSKEIAKRKKDLEKTLKKYYGFDVFRKGQYEIVSSLLHPTNPTDCGVFWATGSGKSLCYQLPALHTNKMAIIISPLISLMQDQCDKLNGSTGKKSKDEDGKIAIFLGSAQTDPNAETDVLKGKYKIVYCTPELLLASDGYFLDKLYEIQDTISLIAVDEAHCVSEWGNDFRPDYRRIGECFQKRPNLKVPLLALTATATPRVRHDIISSLKLRTPKLSIHSFDRDNLELSVFRKPPSNSYMKAFQPLIKEIEEEKKQSSSGGSSTIIYVPSKALVDEITYFLTNQFANSTNIQVQSYHAGLSIKKRTEHHTNFLIGKTDIIVATIAFGMGIDKPDTRRVYHYGAPKTMEEYYQQIGRAGRDGLPAQCVMWANDSDFSKYSSEFYTKFLTREAKEFVKASTESLRTYAMDTEVCRRAALLKYFSEEPPFGEFCGTCDVCLNRKKYQGIDLYRDFRTEGATVVLHAVQALKDPSMSFLEKVMAGKVIEDYRYYPRYQREQTKKTILEERSKMKKKRPMHYFKEMIPSLVQKGFIDQSTKSGGGKYKTTWSVYSISHKGALALSDENAKIVLPVPPSIRAVEAEEEEKRLAAIKQLKEAGVDVSKIPKKELDDGESKIIKAHQKWLSYIDALEKAGRKERLSQMENLRRRIEFWRHHTAEKLRMAPASVLSDHLLVKVAYASATSPTPMVSEALEAAGVRSAGLNHLVEILQSWWRDTNPNVASESIDLSGSNSKSSMVFRSENKNFILTPEKPWEFAVYRPNKKTGKAAWEASYDRFYNGEHPQTIAMNPENGRPIQVNTVVGHVLTALTHGRPVPIERLARVVEAPSKLEWDRLYEAEKVTGFDVIKEPKLSVTQLLRPIMGDAFVDQPRENRSTEDSIKFSNWCRLTNYYLALRRTNYEPIFEDNQTMDV